METEARRAPCTGPARLCSNVSSGCNCGERRTFQRYYCYCVHRMNDRCHPYMTLLTVDVIVEDSGEWRHTVSPGRMYRYEHNLPSHSTYRIYVHTYFHSQNPDRNSEISMNNEQASPPLLPTNTPQHLLLLLLRYAKLKGLFFYEESWYNPSFRSITTVRIRDNPNDYIKFYCYQSGSSQSQSSIGYLPM